MISIFLISSKSMKKLVLTIVLLSSTFSYSRTWTDNYGRTIEAEIIKVNINRTVILEFANNKNKTVSFDIFIPEDVEYLEYLLSRSNRGKLHETSWEQMNDAFGLPIWNDDWLWDDETKDVGNRLNMEFESKTAFLENYRAYYKKNKLMLGEQIYTSSLYGNEKYADSISFVFINTGDAPRSTFSDREKCQQRLLDKLESLLGKSRSDSIGKEELREKVWRWDWNNQAIILSTGKNNYKKGREDSRYVVIKIMPCDRADRGGRKNSISYDQMKERALACVLIKNNGDVLIKNIPMVNQGPKGYCVPATWERYLRYFDMPADMYLLALVGGASGIFGTNVNRWDAIMDPIISSYGKELKRIENIVSFENISKYIDKGLPIMWTFSSTPLFQLEADALTKFRALYPHENYDNLDDKSFNTRKNNYEKIWNDLKEKKYKSTSRNELLRSMGHICLIIGYNEKTNQICISDSWGNKYSERWVSINSMKGKSQSMSIIKW